MATDVNVRWFDGYMEDFKAAQVRAGRDLLWMRLTDGANRNIPLHAGVRWFSTYPESHEARPPTAKAAEPLEDVEQLANMIATDIDSTDHDGWALDGEVTYDIESGASFLLDVGWPRRVVVTVRLEED